MQLSLDLTNAGSVLRSVDKKEKKLNRTFPFGFRLFGVGFILTRFNSKNRQFSAKNPIDTVTALLSCCTACIYEIQI